MMRKVGVVVMVMGMSGLAIAGEPTTKELLDQIKQLQNKVEQLEAKQNQTSADVAATVDKIVNDASRRSQLLVTDGNLVGGWNAQKQQFYLGSEDGNFYF